MLAKIDLTENIKQTILSDVRNMEIFENDYFDFILFSFNGLDAMSHEDRIRALKEIHRVAKNEALYCFSSHNLYSIKRSFGLDICKNPVNLVKSIFKLFLLRYYNKDWKNYKKSDFMTIYDGSGSFKLLLYYISPQAQIEQLKQIGFNNIRLFSLIDGTEIPGDYAKLTTVGCIIFVMCKNNHIFSLLTY